MPLPGYPHADPFKSRHSSYAGQKGDIGERQLMARSGRSQSIAVTRDNKSLECELTAPSASRSVRLVFVRQDRPKQNPTCSVTGKRNGLRAGGRAQAVLKWPCCAGKRSHHIKFTGIGSTCAMSLC
jgi:hypothetical protein